MIQATRKSVCAIIPAFGEARFIGTVVCGILEHVDHVVVVDDYSPDQTTTVAREAGAEVIRHSENLGKGAAIKTGLRKVADNYRRHGFQIEFVPIRTIYGDERSKVKPMRDTFRYIRLLAKYRSDEGSDRRLVFKPKSQKPNEPIQPWTILRSTAKSGEQP